MDKLLKKLAELRDQALRARDGLLWGQYNRKLKYVRQRIHMARGRDALEDVYQLFVIGRDDALRVLGDDRFPALHAYRVREIAVYAELLPVIEPEMRRREQVRIDVARKLSPAERRMLGVYPSVTADMLGLSFA